MNAMTQKFLERINTAFESGDLSDPHILGDALAGLNFIDSAVENDFIKDCLCSLDEKMILGLPIRPARHNDGLCKKPITNLYAPLFWVEDTKTIFKDRHISPMIKEPVIKYINDRLKLDSTSPAAFRRKILWLSDLGGEMPKDGSNAWQLLHDLGYFNRVFENEFCICKVTTDKLHKPTWVDAGFTFFWYSSPPDKDHGQTRSLRNGKPCFKEWVAKKESVTIEDIVIFPMETVVETPNLNLVGLLTDYMRNCADEVMYRRGISCEGGCK
jgi:hypothetical protein